MQGIVFDFNGTLLSDTAIHEGAWRQYIQSLLNRPITEEEFQQIHGRTNHLIMEKFLNKQLTSNEAERYSEEKEAVYRELLLQEETVELIQGVTEFFDYLQEKNVRMNIATASPKSNVDFYFDFFDLGRWFDLEKIVYNDGTLASKPAPDYYLQAAKNVGITPEEMIVFEDSPIGLQGAANAKAKHVVAVATNGNHDTLQELDAVKVVIDDFMDPRLRELI
ncbi:HAD family phosphatase [Enterococcus saccharolyticus]|uniref:HAD family hydrolase n=1 Tax=Enterococcus TaxID=1350 RepID=UPI001E4B7E59|nr:HAD family phosphatase [Enterococcus saccharolyticus]MCD5002927.1 HAD family phosphatase [Enterococcus saccharolyticus]